MRLRFHLAVALCLCAVTVEPAIASSIELPALRRLVYAFDFEEAKFNNFEDLPRNWFVIGRRADTADPNFLRQPAHQDLVSLAGYPDYCPVRFDRPQHEPGQHCLLMGVEGGSVGAFLAIGTIPVVPGSDYLVAVRLRTDDLKHNAAVLTAYFVDAAGRRIESSLRQSQPIQTHSQWREVAVQLRGEHHDAAWLGIQLEVQPPQRRRDSPLGSHQLILQDVAGTVRFDDVTVWQLPRLVVGTQNPVNVIRQPDQPRLSIQVRDLTGQDMQAHAVVYDLAYQPVDQTLYEVGQGRPNSWSWTPTLPRLGWYLVDLQVRERDADHAPIARGLSAFLWLPQAQPMSPVDAPRFVLDAQNTPPGQRELLPQLLDQLHLESAVLSAWDADGDRAHIDSGRRPLDRLIDQLLSAGKHVTLTLNPIPSELTQVQDLDADHPILLFTKSPSVWEPYVAPVMLRYGQRVQQWRLGSPRTAEGFFHANLPALLGRVVGGMRELAPQPRPVLPWRINQSRRRDAEAAAGDAAPLLAMSVPVSVTPDSLWAHLEEWRTPPAADVLLHLESTPADRMIHPLRAEDLALRMVYGWEAGAAGLALTRPWAAGADRQVTLLPDPILGVFTNVAHKLAGRQAVGRVRLASGVRSVIFDGPAGGMIAAWNRRAAPRDALIDEYLGTNPVAVDVWGNRQTIPLVDGRHRLPLSTTPVFIEGIDPQLALMRAAFTLDDPFIESTQVVHERTLTLRNPWPWTISGSMLLTEPAAWNIAPKVHTFSIPAGQTAQMPVRLSFPVSEVAGRKKLVARMDFIAQRHYAVDLSATMEVGLRDVAFDATLAVEPGAQAGAGDVVVTCLITNTGDKTQALYAFAAAPGYPRQERIIARLLPGQSIIRRFRFPGAADRLRHQPLRVGLRETAGPAVLNVILSPDER